MDEASVEEGFETPAAEANPFAWLSAEVLGSIVEVATDGVIVLDRSGTILQVNAAFGRLCRREPWELEGSPIEMLLADDDVDLGGHIGDLVEDSTWTSRTRLRRSDGASVECETWVRAADVDRGTVFVAVQHEPNARRPYGQVMIDDIEARVHELVNSLASLRGYADLVVNDDETLAEEARDRLVGAAKRASGRLELLLAELADVSPQA